MSCLVRMHLVILNIFLQCSFTSDTTSSLSICLSEMWCWCGRTQWSSPAHKGKNLQRIPLFFLFFPIFKNALIIGLLLPVLDTMPWVPKGWIVFAVVHASRMYVCTGNFSLTMKQKERWELWGWNLSYPDFTV